MTLRREILFILVVKLALLLVLKQTFFQAPTVSEDRQALAKKLLDSSTKPQTSEENKL